MKIKEAVCCCPFFSAVILIFMLCFRPSFMICPLESLVASLKCQVIENENPRRRENDLLVKSSDHELPMTSCLGANTNHPHLGSIGQCLGLRRSFFT